MRAYKLAKLSFGISASFLIACVNARSGTAFFDLNSPPSTEFALVGSAEWVPDGGVNNTGHIKLTDNTGQSCAVLFPDFDAGLVVASFEFSCMIKAGDWYGNPPADGWSVNYASALDPIIGLIESGTNPGRGGRSDGWAGSFDNNGNEDNLPEEGTKTGIAIGFDTWGTGNAPVGGSNGPNDVRGISVRVDGVQQTQIAMPSVLFPDDYDYLADATTLITGPFTCGPSPTNPNFGNPECPEGEISPPARGTRLGWAELKVTVDQNGVLNVFWKGQRIVSDLQTTFSPIPGRIVFGASTGGAMEYTGIDNIRITTQPSEKIIIGGVTGNPIGFDITVSDSGPAVADPTSAVLKLDGATITPTSVSKSGSTTTFSYANVASPFAPGSTHEVVLNIKDTRGIAALNDGEVKSFTVPAYVTLDPSLAVTGVDTSKPGFNVRVHQTQRAGQENTFARAEQQLYGLRGDNVAIPDVYEETGVINYDQASANQGNFNSNNGWPENPIPQVDTATYGDDNIAAEITTYLEFPAPGVYQIVFNSDDGFITTVGKNNEVLNSLIVGEFDGGRGAADTVSLVYVPQAGFFPFRTVWFEGGGGANMEWAANMLAPNRTVRTLINGPAQDVDTDFDGVPNISFPAGLRAFRARTGDRPAAVTFVHPQRNPDEGRVTGRLYHPRSPIIVEITDGSTPVDQGSIQLKLNGQAVSVTPSKSGAKTTLRYQPAGGLPAGRHRLEIAFNAGAQQYSAANEFTVRNVPVVPPSMRLPASAVNTANRGFLVKTVQQDIGNNMDNSTYRGRTQIARLYGRPNTADPSLFTGPGGYYQETGVIDYDQAAGGGGGFASLIGVPGIPGDSVTYPALAGAETDRYSQEILTVLELQPGDYVFNVNSDDGFFQEFGNPAETFTLPLVVGEFDGGRGIGGLGGGTHYYFRITEAGFYPARVVWYEGGGGSGIEWTSRSLDANGNLGPLSDIVLINDSTSPIKAYQYPLAHGGAPYIMSFSPGRSGRASAASPGRAGLQPTISAKIADGGGNVDPATVSLSVDGTAVPATVSKDAGVTTVSYRPATAYAPGSQHSVALTFGDRTVNWSFTVGNLPEPAFFIEAEDFNFGGGQHKSEASQMPYMGGAYAGEGAVFDVDYNRGNEGASPLYRIGEDPQVPMDRTGDRDRGITDIRINFKMGWIGDGQWYNYTRNFPAGQYEVYVASSHGNTGATDIRGELQKVTSPANTTGQTVETLGTYSAPGTGGWGNNALVPVKDASGANAKINLSGTTTLRWAPASGDIDFLLFVPAGAAPPSGPTIDSVSLQGGNVVITWDEAGATLQSADAVTGPWNNVAGATSPYRTPASGTQKYFRLVQ